jgi:hypothetical protein
MTLEERLNVLGIESNDGEANSGGVAGDMYYSNGGQVPKTDNLLVLLVQGLQSNDAKMLNVTKTLFAYPAFRSRSNKIVTFKARSSAQKRQSNHQDNPSTAKPVHHKLGQRAEPTLARPRSKRPRHYQMAQVRAHDSHLLSYVG